MSNALVVSSASSSSITLLLFCTLYYRMRSLFMGGALVGVLLCLGTENDLQGIGKYIPKILRSWHCSA
jgi:hypothetical protein